jgi:hypothetical protein
MLTMLADILRRTRQHHAIEHATIHMLSARFPHQRFTGHSDPLGFTLYGDVQEEQVRRAVGDALLRLQAGEHQLAIHPNCGTNLATTSLLVSFAALIASLGKRSLLEKFMKMVILTLPALIMARPLGFRLQTYTTLPAVGDRWVTEIRPVTLGRVQAYRVLFE